MGRPLMEGVLLTPQKRIVQPKGDILHAMKRSAPGYAGFGEAYFSMVQPGEIKGWKKHLRVTLNLVVPVGSVRFAIHDDRPGSATVGRFDTMALGPGICHARLTIAPGLWVAFRGIGEPVNMLLNIANEEHDPEEAENAELEAFALPFI